MCDEFPLARPFAHPPPSPRDRGRMRLLKGVAVVLSCSQLLQAVGVAPAGPMSLRGVGSLQGLLASSLDRRGKFDDNFFICEVSG